jgi:hypothetical protein
MTIVCSSTRDDARCIDGGHARCVQVSMTVTMSCLLVVLGLLLAALSVRAVVLRRRLARSDDVFRCSVRVLRGAVEGLPDGLTGRPCLAEWTHDVLVLHLGRTLTWALPLPVRIAEDVIEPAERAAEARLGAGAVQLRLRLDDDSVIVVAAPARARERLAGPFLAIAARGMQRHG